jgi:hypothetical protein
MLCAHRRQTAKPSLTLPFTSGGFFVAVGIGCVQRQRNSSGCDDDLDVGPDHLRFLSRIREIDGDGDS